MFDLDIERLDCVTVSILIWISCCVFGLHSQRVTHAAAMLHGRETTLNTPSPPRVSPDNRIHRHDVGSTCTASQSTTASGSTSASAAPTLVGVAETAPPWYSPPVHTLSLTDTLYLSYADCWLLARSYILALTQ